MQIGNKKIVSALLCGLLMAGGASAQQVIRFGMMQHIPHLNRLLLAAKLWVLTLIWLKPCAK